MSIPSPDPDWQVIEIGGLWTSIADFFHGIGIGWFPTTLQIHVYALCLLAGMIVAAVITGFRLKRRGVDGGYVIDIAVWAILLGIVVARLFHVLTHPDDYFGAGSDPWEIVRVWNGGIAIFGALIGGALGIFIACKQTGLRFSTVVDALAPGLLLAQAIGRLGNYVNHELFGIPTQLPWGLEIESSNPAFPVGLPDGTLFHPTFLYEIIWNVLGVLFLLWLDRKRTVQWGKLIGVYLIWYGVGRSVWETIRIDPSEVFLGIRTNVWAAYAAIVIGIVVLIVQSRRHPGLEPSPWAPGREPEPEDAVASDVYTDADDDTHAPASSATDTAVATK